MTPTGAVIDNIFFSGYDRISDAFHEASLYILYVLMQAGTIFAIFVTVNKKGSDNEVQENIAEAQRRVRRRS
jgi:hypothetical protein